MADRKEIIRRILCQFGTILTLFWASSLLLSNEVITNMNGKLNSSPIANIIATAVLVFFGFKLTERCGGTSCDD